MASTKRSIIPRLICRWLDFHCPQAKQRLATAVLGSAQLPHCTDDEADAIGSGDDREECTVGAQTFDLRLEAIGSGVLLLSGLTIASTASVWDLKTLIALERTNTPAGRQRLFVGHGGIELLDDTAPLNEFLFSQRTLSMMLVDFEFQLLIVLLHGNILHRVRRSIICTVKPNQTIKSLRDQIDFFPECTHCVDPSGNRLPNERTLLGCNIGASGLFVTFTPDVTHLVFFEVLQGGGGPIHYPDVDVRLAPHTPIRKVKEIFCTQCRPDLEPDDIQLFVHGENESCKLDDNMFSLQEPSRGWGVQLKFDVVVPLP